MTEATKPAEPTIEELKAQLEAALAAKTAAEELLAKQANENGATAKPREPSKQYTMNAPKGATGCSFDGKEYKVEKGQVTIPEEAVTSLMDHGYEIASAK